MPRVRRRLRERRGWTDRQLEYIEHGICLGGPKIGHPFSNDAELKQCWDEYGLALAERHNEVFPGSRSKCWWRFASPKPRQVVGHQIWRRHAWYFGKRHVVVWYGDPDPILELEVCFLERHGLLTIDEKRAFLASGSPRDDVHMLPLGLRPVKTSPEPVAERNGKM